MIDPNGHDIADCDHIGGVLDEAVAEFGDVDHAVLFDPDVDKGAEVHNVADGPLQFHPWLQVLH